MLVGVLEQIMIPSLDLINNDSYLPNGPDQCTEKNPNRKPFRQIYVPTGNRTSYVMIVIVIDIRTI